MSNTQTIPLQQETSREFYRRMISIALPIMLQNLLISSLSFVDTLMIGQLGSNEIAAVGLANQMFFLINMFFFGVSSGASIFVSQFWGAKNKESIQKVMGIALTTGIIGATIFSIVSIAAPEVVMHIFTFDENVVARGCEYLRVVGISYIFTAVTSVYSTTLRATGDAKTPLIIACFALSFNALFNWFLIFGIGPFPRMEVAGAALATTGSRFIEMMALIIWSQVRKTPAKLNIRQAVKWDKPFLRAFFPTCLPVVCNEVFWALGMTTYKIAFSKMGIDVIASVNVTEAINSLFFVVMMGVSNATAIMIGIKIGAGDQAAAKLYGKRFVRIGLWLGICIGLFMGICSPFIPRLFNVSSAIYTMTMRSLIVGACLMPIKSVNMNIIVGILRSGGDTKFSMFAEMFGVWCVGVPCAFLGALVLHLPIWWLYLLLGLEELSKFLLGTARVRSGKWLNDLTRKAA